MSYISENSMIWYGNVSDISHTLNIRNTTSTFGYTKKYLNPTFLFNFDSIGNWSNRIYSPGVLSYGIAP